MPRLPTMRVMGSQFISTRPPLVLAAAIAMTRLLCFSKGELRPSPLRLVPGRQGPTRLAPLRLLVQRLRREGAERTQRASPEPHGFRREAGARRLVHER